MAQFTRETGRYQGKDGSDIFFHQWIPDKPTALLVIVHGIGEHSARYNESAELWASKRVAVFAADLRGHGSSSGQRGHIQSFRDYLFDIKILINKVKESYKGLPLFLLGHSMGGVIATRYALMFKRDAHALIISSPGFIPLAKVPAVKKLMSGVMSSLMPAYTFDRGMNPAHLSHDEAEVQAYASDPLVHNAITPRLYTELISNAAFCLEHGCELKMPLLIFHGTEDAACSIAGSEKLFEQAESDDKTFIPLQGLYHESLHELIKDRKKTIALVASWITERQNSLLHPAKTAAVKKTSSPAKQSTSVMKKPVSKKSTAKKKGAKKSSR